MPRRTSFLMALLALTVEVMSATRTIMGIVLKRDFQAGFILVPSFGGSWRGNL